jgi:hypothetical protein
VRVAQRGKNLKKEFNTARYQSELSILDLARSLGNFKSSIYHKGEVMKHRQN